MLLLVSQAWVTSDATHLFSNILDLSMGELEYMQQVSFYVPLPCS